MCPFSLTCWPGNWRKEAHLAHPEPTAWRELEQEEQGIIQRPCHNQGAERYILNIQLSISFSSLCIPGVELILLQGSQGGHYQLFTTCRVGKATSTTEGGGITYGSRIQSFLRVVWSFVSTVWKSCSTARCSQLLTRTIRMERTHPHLPAAGSCSDTPAPCSTRLGIPRDGWIQGGCPSIHEDAQLPARHRREDSEHQRRHTEDRGWEC